MNAYVSEKASIRVDTGAKRIEVNDDGEYITLNFADQSFVTRFFNMVDDFESKRTEYERQAKELDGNAELSEYERSRQAARFNLEIHEYFLDKVDGLFGQGTCRKAFGDIVPSVDLYADFLTQLMPFFEKYGKERAKKMNQKYSPARKGGRSHA